MANNYAEHPQAFESWVHAGQKSAMAIPLFTPEGPMGVLAIASRSVDHFTPDRIKVLAAIGDGLGGLLEKAGLHQQLQDTTTEMAVVDEVARIITSTLDIDQVYEQFAAEVKKLVDFDRSSINLLDFTGSAFDVAYIFAGEGQNYPKGAHVELSEAHSAWVVENHETVILNDLTQDSTYKASSGPLADGLSSMIAVPLMNNGKALGTFSLASKRINAYGHKERVTLERLASQIAPAIENARLYQEAKEQALVLASIDDAVLFKDREGTIKFINRAFEEMFGYSSDEVLGKHVIMFTPSDSASQEQRREIVSAAMLAPWKGEVQRVRKNGEQFDIDLSLSPVKDREDKVVGFIVTVRDITVAKRAEEALRQNEAEATRLAGEKAMLAEIGRIVSSSLDVNEVYDRFAQEVRKQIPFDRIVIVTPDAGNKTAIIADILSNVEVMHRQEGNAVILPGGIAYEVIKTQKELLLNVEDVETAKARFPQIRSHLDVGLRSFMATPLVSPDQVIAVLQVQSAQANAYSKRDLRLVSSIGAQIAGAGANSQLYAEGVQTEKALRESQESNRQMALFAQLNPAPVLRFDTTGAVLLANSAAIDILGGDEQGYAPLSSVLPGVAALDLKQLIEHGDVVSHETQFLGKHFQLVLRGVPELGVGQLYGTDISEIKSLEEHLRKISQAVEQSPFGVAITSLEGNIEYANERLTQITGYTMQELLGSKTSVWASKATTKEEYTRIWDTITSGEVWRGELLNRRKDGQTYWVLESISPIRDPSGGITHFVAILEDVTERKFLEEQLNQAQKMDSMGQLASGVAHDFNNLLTAIVGYAQLGSATLPSENPVADYLQAISQAAERAADLTNQLLVFSRRQPVTPRVLDLNHLIIDFDRMLRRLLGVNIELVVLLAPDLKAIKADPTQMDQVLMNLAVNAKDAMPHGGKLIIETSNVSLSQSRVSNLPDVSPGEYVMLSVTDTGEGIPEEVKSRIFEPFFTTKAIGKGTGLGLATCYGFVKQCGGYIQVESERSKGSTFRVYLPKTDAEVDHADDFPAGVLVLQRQLV